MRGSVDAKPGTVCQSVGVAGLTLRAERQDTRAVLHLTGELDLATIADLRLEVTEHLADADVRELVLDLNGLTFLDSSGLGALLQVRSEALSRGATLSIVQVPAAPARTIAIAGLNSTFGIEDPPAS